jgi:hypothetical protein
MGRITRTIFRADPSFPDICAIWARLKGKS